MSVAATPAEAGFRDHVQCHWIKKTSWSHGRKHTRWVKACASATRLTTIAISVVFADALPPFACAALLT